MSADKQPFVVHPRRFIGQGEIPCARSSAYVARDRRRHGADAGAALDHQGDGCRHGRRSIAGGSTWRVQTGRDRQVVICDGVALPMAMIRRAGPSGSAAPESHHAERSVTPRPAGVTVDCQSGEIVRNVVLCVRRADRIDSNDGTERSRGGGAGVYIEEIRRGSLDPYLAYRVHDNSWKVAEQDRGLLRQATIRLIETDPWFLATASPHSLNTLFLEALTTDDPTQQQSIVPDVTK
jgi:hypothetical protein